MPEIQFHGRSYSQQPLTGEESARIRHMLETIDGEWVPISQAVTVVQAIGIISAIVKIGGPVALLSLGAGAFAKSQGWL